MNMEKKSRLQRRLEYKAKGKPAKLRAIAKDPRARRTYRLQMAMSRGKQALGGGAQGAILGGIAGNIANQLAMTRYRDIPTSKAVGAGMALGGAVGAASGFAKAGRGWYRARRETQAVGKAYAGMKERQYKKTMREDLIDRIIVEGLADKFAGGRASKKVQDLWLSVHKGGEKFSQKKRQIIGAAAKGAEKAHAKAGPKAQKVLDYIHGQHQLRKMKK